MIHQAIEKSLKFDLKFACDRRAAQRSIVRIAQELLGTIIGIWTSVLWLTISLYGSVPISIETTVHYSIVKHSEIVESAFHKGREGRQPAKFQKR